MPVLWTKIRGIFYGNMPYRKVDVHKNIKIIDFSKIEIREEILS